MSNNLPSKNRSFYPPFRVPLLGRNGLISQEYRRFFEGVWERVFTLGTERSYTLINGIADTTFATTDVDTTDDEITFTGHPFVSGMEATFTTTGTLPGGLSTSTPYWIIVVDANTIKVTATSRVNAIKEIGGVNLTSVGSGTHTIVPKDNIEGLLVNNKGVSSGVFEYLVQRVTTGGGATELIENGAYTFNWRPTSETWDLDVIYENQPDNAGVAWFINDDGQFQYQTTSITGTASISKLYFKLRTLSGKNIQYSQVGYI